jgi:hypothetical protein
MVHSGKPDDQSGPPPEKWFNLLGLVVVRRTDLLAAAAFALSISTLTYQLWQFTRGASPAMYHPDTLYVFFDKYANGVIATRIAGQLSFTNSGDAGHNAIIRDVSATVNTGKKAIEEEWLSFAKVTRSDTELLFDIKESAHPVVIEGGGASSYMVTFSPRVRDCSEKSPSGCNEAVEFVSDIDFIKDLYGSKELVITFLGTLFDSRSKLMTSCTTAVTNDMINTIAMNGWYAARCASVR